MVGDERSFLTDQAWALAVHRPRPRRSRLRDLAAALNITERTAYGLVADLTDAVYMVKERDGRWNRYQIQVHQPLRTR